MEKRMLADQWIVLNAGVGLFLSTLDTGIINVALPTLSQIFDSSIMAVTWTITSYTLALVGSILLFGRLSDRFGRLKVYTWGLFLFLIASILCGFSTSLDDLIAFRTIQGFGAAMLQATAAAIVTTLIPEVRQGTALGTLGVILGLGPVLGPSIGGLLISAGSWRWLFWVNIPFALAGIAGCFILIKSIEETPKLIKLDFTGNLLLSLFILTLLQGFSISTQTGLLSLPVLLFMALFAVLFFLFICWERRFNQPVVDMKLFKNGRFTASFLGLFVLGGATSLGFIIPPYFLEQVSRLDAWQAGFINLSAPLGLVLMSKLSGQLINKVGCTSLMVIGLILMTLADGLLGLMQSDWSPLLLSVLLILYGIGAGLFVPPNMSFIMGTASQAIQGTISATLRMVQNLGIALFAAITSAILQFHSQAGPEQLMGGFRQAWDFAAISLIFSLATFLFVIVLEKGKQKKSLKQPKSHNETRDKDTTISQKPITETVNKRV